MSKNPALEEKAQRFKWLIAVMEKRKREKFTTLSAQMQLNFGLSKEKAEEHIRICVLAGCFQMEENDVVFVTSSYGA